METFFFYFLAVITVISSLMVTLSRNTVNGAMFMILSLISTAGLFGTLGAYFLAALQVLVYAGAVMVLFVFIIMMIEIRDEEKRKFGVLNIVAAIIAGGVMVAGIIGLALSPEMAQAFPTLPETVDSALTFSGKAQNYGVGLYGKYFLPIQVMGFLLLLAMVGVILISKDLSAQLGLSKSSDKTQPTDSNS